MKILIVQPYLHEARGAEKQAINLVLELNKMGIESSLLTFFTKVSPALEELIKKIDIKTYPKLPYFKYVHSLYPILISLKNFAKITKSFDIINLHNYPATWVANSSKKPCVWMCNEVPWSYPFSKKLKFVFNKIQNFYKKIDYKIVKNKIKKIIVLDKKRKEDVKKYYNIDASIVRSGIDINLYHPIKKSRAKEELRKLFKIDFSEFVLLFVSNLAEPKRLIDFLEANIIVKNKGYDITCMIVGDGPDSSLIKNFANKINILHFSNVPERVMPYIYSSSDLLIFPAVKQPWGLVPFEAMACKCPVIISKDTGAAEVLSHMENSIIVKPYNPKIIANWTATILENKNLYKSLSSKGYKFVKNNITTKNYAKNMLKVFESILSSDSD